MSEELRLEVLEFLDKQVRELAEGMDWLGTGSDSRAADREAREWMERLEEMIAKVRNGK